MEKHKFLKNNYTAGNILNLLLQLYSEKDFQYWDLSEIDIWGVDFRDAILTGVDFNDSDLKNCIFTQPLGCIHSIAFNADGNYFATGDAHGLIRVHNTETLDLCFFEKGAGNQIWSVAFSLGTNSQRFALAAEDGSVKLFEIENLASGKLNFKETHSWRETGRVLSVAFSLDAESNILAFGGDGNNAITVYRIKENEMIHLAASNVSCMTFIDNSILYSCSQEGDFIGWDLSTRNPQIFYQERKRHEKLIRCIAFNATKQIIATGSEDGKLKIFDTNNKQDLQFQLVYIENGSEKDYEYTKYISEIRTLAFSCDGSILAIGCICKNTPEQSEDKDKSEDKNKSEHKILLFDLTGDKWKLIDTLDNSRSENQDHNGHTHLIRSIAFSPNTDKPRFLISGGDGRTVKLWDWNKDQKKWNCQDNLRGYANRVWSVAFSSNKKIFACGCEDNKIYIWNYNDRTHIPIPIHSTSKHTDWVWSVAFNYDGTLLASGSEDKTIGLWQFKENNWNLINPEAENTSETNQLLNIRHTKRVRCVAFHPTENILASTGNDNIVILWDLRNLNNIKVLSKFTNHTDRVLSLAFSPDGHFLASSSRDKTIRLIDIVDSEPSNDQQSNSSVLEKQLEGHQDQVHSIAFIKNTEGLVFPKEQENPPETQEIKPFLVSSGFDRQLILWGINHNNTSVEKLCSVNEGQRILSVACHPTELIIASAGHDCIIILWKIEKNEKNEYVFKKIKILKGHKRAVESIVFTPDCKRLISCGQDQTIKFWEVEGNVNTSIHTIELGKPYQDMNISGVKNLDDAQISALKELGASSD